jgi:hypothetical protein
LSRLPGKRARPVPRGRRRGNAPGLPDEIYFSAVQRKLLTPNDFTSLGQIRDRLAALETRYNAIARPFSWKFTRTDLNDLLHRIDAHDKVQPHALAA